MANSRIDPRRIKTHFPYTVEEAADALGVHKNTVRMWIKGGLAVADDRRPTVMSGAAIRAFLENRLKARRSPLKPGEFYCFRCREPKSPAGGIADFVAAGGGLGTLTGLCPDCETIMHRRASRLDETTEPFLNRDSGKGKDPMAKSKTPNERIKRAYIDFLRQAMGRSEASLEAVAAGLHRFESYTRFRDSTTSTSSRPRRSNPVLPRSRTPGPARS
jgi:Helix-turn-helix domain